MRRPGTLPPGRREYSIGPVTDLREPKVGSRDRALFDFQRPHETWGSLCRAPLARLKEVAARTEPPRRVRLLRAVHPEPPLLDQPACLGVRLRELEAAQ